MILEINSDPSELKKVREKVEIFCKENQIKVNLLEIKLAIDEALQNIIRHAYKLDKTKKITIKLEKYLEIVLKQRLEILANGFQ
jgi:anti-sigma regulatory factor (Ser/Thr protein kinase)